MSEKQFKTCKTTITVYSTAIYCKVIMAKTCKRSKLDLSDLKKHFFGDSPIRSFEDSIEVYNELAQQ